MSGAEIFREADGTQRFGVRTILEQFEKPHTHEDLLSAINSVSCMAQHRDELRIFCRVGGIRALTLLLHQDTESILHDTLRVLALVLEKITHDPDVHTLSADDVDDKLLKRLSVLSAYTLDDEIRFLSRLVQLRWMHLDHKVFSAYAETGFFHQLSNALVSESSHPAYQTLLSDLNRLMLTAPSMNSDIKARIVAKLVQAMPSLDETQTDQVIRLIFETGVEISGLMNSDVVLLMRACANRVTPSSPDRWVALQIIAPAADAFRRSGRVLSLRSVYLIMLTALAKGLSEAGLTDTTETMTLISEVESVVSAFTENEVSLKDRELALASSGYVQASKRIVGRRRALTSMVPGHSGIAAYLEPEAYDQPILVTLGGLVTSNSIVGQHKEAARSFIAQIRVGGEPEPLADLSAFPPEDARQIYSWMLGYILFTQPTDKAVQMVRKMQRTVNIEPYAGPGFAAEDMLAYHRLNASAEMSPTLIDAVITSLIERKPPFYFEAVEVIKRDIPAFVAKLQETHLPALLECLHANEDISDYRKVLLKVLIAFFKQYPPLLSQSIGEDVLIAVGLQNPVYGVPPLACRALASATASLRSLVREHGSQTHASVLHRHVVEWLGEVERGNRPAPFSTFLPPDLPEELTRQVRSFMELYELVVDDPGYWHEPLEGPVEELVEESFADVALSLFAAFQTEGEDLVKQKEEARYSALINLITMYCSEPDSVKLERVVNAVKKCSSGSWDLFQLVLITVHGLYLKTGVTDAVKDDLSAAFRGAGLTRLTSDLSLMSRLTRPYSLRPSLTVGAGHVARPSPAACTPMRDSLNRSTQRRVPWADTGPAI